MLISQNKPLLDESWLQKINTGIKDTGNALTDDEIREFSSRVHLVELKKYCIAVGANSRTILNNLELQDFSRKPTAEEFEKIFNKGGLTKQKNSIWLLDYWGSLDVAGLILAPLTDHFMIRLPSCIETMKANNK